MQTEDKTSYVSLHVCHTHFPFFFRLFNNPVDSVAWWYDKNEKLSKRKGFDKNFPIREHNAISVTHFSATNGKK
jgi:hypothetical protein